MARTFERISLVVLVPLFVSFAAGQTSSTQPEKPKEPSEEGIPVTDQLVKDKCGTCHKADEKGRMTRISWQRTTPEGWELTIKRMVRRNGLSLSPAEARGIVK